jgi:GcrA cell cycle regulator
MAKTPQKPKTLDMLEANDCRWPIGDPRHEGFHFCGAQKIDGRPYCAHHWSLSFVPGKSRAPAMQAPMLIIKAAA